MLMSNCAEVVMSIYDRLYVRPQDKKKNGQVEEVFVPSPQAQLLCQKFIYFSNQFYRDYLEIESALSGKEIREDTAISFEVFGFFHYLLEHVLFESSQVPNAYHQVLHVCQSYIFIRFKEMGNITDLRNALLLRQNLYQSYFRKADTPQMHNVFIDQPGSPFMQLLEVPNSIDSETIILEKKNKYDDFTAAQKRQMMSELSLGYVKSFWKIITSCFCGNNDITLSDEQAFALKLEKIIGQLDLKLDLEK
jgi:hypothetical protein